MSDELGGAGRPSPDGGGNGGPSAGGGRGGDSPGGRGESASETKATPSRKFEQKKKKKNRENDRTRWPWWAQLILAIVALVTACGLLIVIPVYVASVRGGVESMDRSLMAMIAVFVGLTTMTISGMFLFMTFRIDRGAKAEAGKVAGKEARRIARKAVKAELDAELGIVRTAREAREKITRAGDDVVKRVEEIRDHEVIPKVGAAGDDAVKRVEEIRDHEVIPKVGAAGEKVESETDQMIEEARRKIDAADIETLVNARLDAFLEQADGWPRRLFLRFLRPREPRS